jgi:hypothetical protein
LLFWPALSAFWPALSASNIAVPSIFGATKRVFGFFLPAASAYPLPDEESISRSAMNFCDYDKINLSSLSDGLGLASAC